MTSLFETVIEEVTPRGKKTGNRGRITRRQENRRQFRELCDLLILITGIMDSPVPYKEMRISISQENLESLTIRRCDFKAHSPQVFKDSDC